MKVHWWLLRFLRGEGTKQPKLRQIEAPRILHEGIQWKEFGRRSGLEIVVVIIAGRRNDLNLVVVWAIVAVIWAIIIPSVRALIPSMNAVTVSLLSNV